jgi:hypothetical protein
MKHRPYITRVIKAVACPTCEAPAGKECIRRDGKPSGLTRQARLQAASENGIKVP